MSQPAGTYLASFNLGTLRYDWDDPRLRVLARQSPCKTSPMRRNHVDAIA